MLLDIRDGIRNSKWLKYILVGIICVPFVFFGVSSYLGGGGHGYAAKVNGTEIPLRSYENAYNQVRGRLAQTFGGSLPEGLDLQPIASGQAMDTVIRQEVLRQATENNGFAIGDDALAQELISNDAFTVDGVFDKDRYTLQLQSMGVSASEFEDQFRGDLLLRQFQNSVVSTGFALKDESAQLESLRSQMRSASYITLDVQARADTIEVTDDEVTQHYDANLTAFNNPEKVKVEYIELNIDDVKDTVEYTDEDISGYFEQNKTQWVAPEKRVASHILLAIDRDASDSDVEDKLKEANDLFARIGAGESLASLAPDASDDPGSADNGGSLGEFGRGVMVPEFEEMAFSMGEGDVSEPIRSDFGFHIIQLDKIIGERGQSFEEVKDEVKDQYLTQQAQSEYYSVTELLSNSSFENSDSLQPASDESGLELQTSDWIDSNLTDGLGAYPRVLAAALSDDVLNNGANSEVIEVGENHAIVLRTIEHAPAAPKPIDEVREDIVSRVQNEKATEALQSLADDVITELEGGADAATVASNNEAEFVETAALARTDAETDRAIVQRLFTMPKPEIGSSTYAKVTDSSGNIAVIDFSGVAESEAAEGDTPAPASAQAPAVAEFNAMISAIEEDADIERNEAVLSQGAYQ